MIVMILKKVLASLKGELSRWMIEPKAGFFVGSFLPRCASASGAELVTEWEEAPVSSYTPPTLNKGMPSGSGDYLPLAG